MKIFKTYIVSILILAAATVLSYFLLAVDKIVPLIILAGDILSTIYFIKSMIKLKNIKIFLLILIMPSFYYTLLIIKLIIDLSSGPIRPFG